MGILSPIEQNYNYNEYGHGSKIPFGGLTLTPRVNPPVTVEPTTGISIPTQHSFVTDENGNKISMGQDGVGLAHRNPDEYNFMGIA